MPRKPRDAADLNRRKNLILTEATLLNRREVLAACCRYGKEFPLNYKDPLVNSAARFMRSSLRRQLAAIGAFLYLPLADAEQFIALAHYDSASANTLTRQDSLTLESLRKQVNLAQLLSEEGAAILDVLEREHYSVGLSALCDLLRDMDTAPGQDLPLAVIRVIEGLRGALVRLP